MTKNNYLAIDIRCEKCNRKLAEAKAYKKDNYDLEIKCPKCGNINKI